MLFMYILFFLLLDLSEAILALLRVPSEVAIHLKGLQYCIYYPGLTGGLRIWKDKGTDDKNKGSLKFNHFAGP